MDKTMKVLLTLKRKGMGKHNRVKTQNNPPAKMLYPWALEKAYARMIKGLLAPIISATKIAYRGEGNKILRGDSLHLDAQPGKTAKMTYQELKARVAASMPEEPTPTMQNALEGMANQLKKFNDGEFFKQTRQYLGFDFDTSAEWWPTTLESWSTANYSLIRSLASQYIERVNILAEKAVTSGTGYYDLMKSIDALGQTLPEGRSRLIARDQVGKLNGRITQARQEDLGIDQYVWMTALDERVRGNPGGIYPTALPSHWDMEGLVCRWDDATVYSEDDGKTWDSRKGSMPMEHPGEPIQCRCTSAPNWRPLLKELDAELDAPV